MFLSLGPLRKFGGCLKILLTGVSCVGKTAIGSRLGEKLDYPFFNLDNEVEIRNKKSIEQMQSKYISCFSYQKEIYCPVLQQIINSKKNENIIVELPPSGLRYDMYKIVKQIDDGITIALQDTPENILKRIVFFDYYSRKIDKILTPEEEKHYLKEIQFDNTFYKKYYQRAMHRLDISGLTIDECVNEIIALIGL